jgi:phosphoglycerate dehydrogenase-like enzyme
VVLECPLSANSGHLGVKLLIIGTVNRQLSIVTPVGWTYEDPEGDVMLRVVFVGALPASFAGRVGALLAVGSNIAVTDEAGVAAFMPEAEVLVTMVFTATMGAAASRLRLVQVPGAGLDRIDRLALPSGVALANVHGHETGIAEYVIGAMLALSRNFTQLDTNLRSGRWNSQWVPGVPPPPVWPELAGRTLAILGYGRIGQAVARRARVFGMHVVALRRDAAQADSNAVIRGPEALGDLLAQADHVVITLPLTPATRGLIGEREIRAMKPGAFLINVARAEIVDEQALYRALQERQIAGAALDVWYRYPTSSDPVLPSTCAFHELPNVLMTPHVSGWTDGMLEARAKLIAENIQRVASGEAPLNRVP